MAEETNLLEEDKKEESSTELVTENTTETPVIEDEPSSGSGFVFEKDKDGNIVGASYEGEIAQPGRFSASEKKKRGQEDNFFDKLDITQQVPGFATLDTLSQGTATALTTYLKEGWEKGYLNEEAFEEAWNAGSEYVLNDIRGGGLGKSVSRSLMYPAVGTIQNLANAAADDGTRTVDSPDVPVLFGKPLQRVEPANVAEGLLGAGAWIYLLVRGGKALTGIAGGAIPGTSKAYLSQATQPLNAKVSAILKGAASPQGNLTKFRVGNWGLWQDKAIKSGRLFAEGIIPGAVFDYAAVDPMPTGYWEELENGKQKWVSTMPAWMPYLAKIAPDDLEADAKIATVQEGVVMGGGFNHLFAGMGRAYRAFNHLQMRKTARFRAEAVAKIIAHEDAGGAPIDEIWLKKQNLKRPVSKQVEREFKYLRERTPRLWETRGITVQETLDLSKKSTEERQSILANAADDQELAVATQIAVEAAESLNNEMQLSRVSADPGPGVTTTPPDFVEAPTSTPLRSQVRTEPVKSLTIRPKQMQYKEAGLLTKSGQSGSVSSADSFKPELAGVVTVWRDPATQELVVVNGHNRFYLAQKFNAENINVLEIEAPDAQTARTVGAIQNIAEGNGTAFDAAKLMRDTGLTAEDLRGKGVDLGGKIANDAIPISRLPDDVFLKGTQGTLSVEKAAALGSVEGLDDAIIRDVAKKASKHKWPADKIKQAVSEAKFAVVEEGEESLLTLLGDKRFDPKTSNFGKIVDLRTEALKRLREDIIALTHAARGGKSKEILEGAGNVIDPATSRTQRDEAAAAVRIFNQVIQYSGPVRDLINEMADSVDAKNTVKKVVDANLDRLRTAIQQDFENGFAQKPAPEPRKVTRQVKKAETRVLKTEIKKKVGRKKIEPGSPHPSDPNKVRGNDGRWVTRRYFEKVQKSREGADKIIAQVEGKAVESTEPSPTLPANLAKSQYNYREMGTSFDSDVDRSIAIVTKTQPSTKKLVIKGYFSGSKRNQQFLDFLQKEVGLSDEEILTRANEIRNELKSNYSPGTVYSVKDGGIWKPAPETVTPEPTPAPTKSKTTKAITKVDESTVDPWLDDEVPFDVPDEDLPPLPPEQPKGEIVKKKEEPAPVKKVDTEPVPVETALTKLDKQTPISKLIRLAPEGQQTEIAIDRIIAAWDKFDAGFKIENRIPALDTVGDLINFLNIARVIVEEGTQKGLRDLDATIKAFDRLKVYLQAPTTKLFPGLQKFLLEDGRVERGYKRKVARAQKEIEALDLGPEPEIPDVPGGIGEGQSELRAKYDAALRANNEWWAKVEAVEEKYGLIKSWDEILDEGIYEPEELDLPGLLAWRMPGMGGTRNLSPLPLSNRLALTATENVNLRDEIVKIAGDVDVRFVKTIEGMMTPDQARAYGVEPGTPYYAGGKFIYEGLEQDTVLVSMFNGLGEELDFRTRLSNAHHEAFHRLQLRFLTVKEIKTLKKSEKALRKFASRFVDGDLKAQVLDGTTDMMEVEAIAFSGWWKDGDLPEFRNATWAEPFKKIEQILRRTLNYLQGNGYQTWEDIFDDALFGDIAERGPRDWERTMGGGGPFLSVDNTSRPPDFDEGDADSAKRFADNYQANKEKLISGETNAGELWAENKLNTTQSQSGKWVYNAQSEDLMAGQVALGKEMGGSRAEITDIPDWNGVELQRKNHNWFKKRQADGEAILNGLQGISGAFYKYELGALHRALDFSDKLQMKAQLAAANWINASSNPGVDKRVALARLIVAADSTRRMQQAIAKITRRWSHLGLEMQTPRDIDTYQLPDGYKLPAIADDVEITEPRNADGSRGEGIVDQALREETSFPEGSNPAVDELGERFAGLKDALETGDVDMDSQVSADEIANTILVIGESPASADKIWTKWDEVNKEKLGDPAKRENPWKAVQLIRSSSLISGGITSVKGITNGILNLSYLTTSQSVGGLLAGDLDRSLYSMQMFGNYWNNLRQSFRNASIAFKTGRPIGNIDRSSLDFLDKIAKQDAQGELGAGQPQRQGYTINSMDLDSEYAKTTLGKLQTALWRILATPGARMAVSIDSFNSTLAGWSYEFYKHMPRGMELAVENGRIKNSKEAFDFAYEYAGKRVDNAVVGATIDGKTIGEVALEGRDSQKFMDAVNFTDDVMAQLEERTIEDGFARGKRQGLEGQELNDYALKWVKDGDWLQKIAEGAMNGNIQYGRLASMPGYLLTEAANLQVIGPVVKFVQPFMRVPTNIFKSTLRSSPLAFTVDTFWRDIASADPGARQRAIGQVVLGSSALALATVASNVGGVRFNGGGPIDVRAKQKWMRDRQLPYSVQFWNSEEGYWDAPVSMAALEPFSTLFGALGDYNDVQAMISKEDRERLGEAIVLDLVKLMVSGQISKSYFQGISELVDAAFDPSKAFTGPNRRSAISRLLQRTIASMMPLSGAVRQARRQVDPYPRSIEADPEGGMMGFFRETFAEIRNAIPGYSESNPAIVDWTAPGGPPVHSPSLFMSRALAEDYPWMAAATQFVPPFAAFQRGKQISDPVAQEMANLHGKGTSFMGPMASDFGDEELYLSPSELNKYREVFANVKSPAGFTWHEAMTRMVRGKAYLTLPIEPVSANQVSYRAGMIQALITEFKKYAKEEFIRTTVKGQEIRLAKKAKEERATMLDQIQINQYSGGNANYELLDLNR